MASPSRSNATAGAVPAPELEALPLAAAVSAVSAAHPDLKLSWGRGGNGYLPLSELCVPGHSALDAWLGHTAALLRGADSKTAAAYLVSIFTFRLGQAVGAMYLSGVSLPELTAADVSLRVELVGAGDPASLDHHLRISSEPLGRPFDRDAMRRSLVALHTPLAEALAVRASLARRASWRLVADGISAGFLAFGKQVGAVELAVTEAEAILHAPETPLHNPDWQFVSIEGAGLAETFRLRGGCCRRYRSSDHEFCTTCVLRTPADQVARLQAFLRRKAERRPNLT
jgi:hypothetical protein